jgi:hypothetical protein
MADPTSDPISTTMLGTIAGGVVAFLVALRTWANKDKVDSSAAGAEIAYNKAAQGIVERLERELVEVHQRLDIAERERDECNAKYAKLQQVMLEMANKMLTVQGLQELGHTVIDRLKDEQWREDAL